MAGSPARMPEGSYFRSVWGPDATLVRPPKDVMKAAILPAGGCYPPAGVNDLTQEDGHALLWSRSAREVQQLLPGELVHRNHASHFGLF